MSTLMQVTLVCDRCGVEAKDTEDSDLKTHTIQLDRRRPMQLEFCSDCWAEVEAVVTPARA